jgi:histidine kinase
MTIRKRLILSYLAMLFVPFILIMLTIGVMRSFESSIERGPFGPFSENRFPNSSVTDNDLLIRLNQIVLNSPASLLTNDFMNNLEKDLVLPGAFAVVQHDIIMYKSSWISSSTVIEAIQQQMANTNDRGFRKHIAPEVLFRWEFSIPDQPNGILYYIIDPARLFTNRFTTGLIFFLVAALALVVTNGTLTYLVSRSIISPLKELEAASLKIRDGNLNDSIICKYEDEMGQVFSSFNEMRERLKKSLERQIAYEENRKELIASISHDLKTPLTILKGYLEGLRDGVANTEEKKLHYLDTIYQKTHLMDHLIDDLFLFSRLEMEKYPYDPVPIELSAWLANAVNDLSVDYPEICFQTSLVEKAVISADPTEMYRVISNIVQNSHHYAGIKNVVVTIGLRTIGKQAEIIITDNGNGIPEQQLPFIFNRFYQADDSRNQNSNGAGLGLSIAAMITSQHQGTIRAESPAGKGLSVIITLPIASELNRENNQEDD